MYVVVILHVAYVDRKGYYILKKFLSSVFNTRSFHNLIFVVKYMLKSHINGITYHGFNSNQYLECKI